MQWNCYLKACNDYNWNPLPCHINQACLYVTLLSERLKLSSIICYYQSVIFHHVCVGLEPIRISNPVLQATLKGIEKGQSSKGKDPILPQHLLQLRPVINVLNEVELLVWVAVLVIFRSLLRISHIVKSPHTLRVCDVQLSDTTCILKIHSSKTTSKGDPHEIPICKAK